MPKGGSKGGGNKGGGSSGGKGGGNKGGGKSGSPIRKESGSNKPATTEGTGPKKGS